MLVPLLAGFTASLAALTLRLLKGKPDWRGEVYQLSLALVLAFIDAFMIAYLAPFTQIFVSRFSFHLFLYTLFASLTAVLYAMYRASSDIRVYAVAMAPWFLILALIIAANLLGSRIVFIF
ncbi:MAG: hypothetical protein QXW23_07315 [Thermofilaceae archaeon]